MNKINTIFSLTSLVVLIIIIERLLPYTRGLIQPYDSIQVHQLLQTTIFIPVTVILTFFLLKIITNDFQALKEKGNAFLALIFVVGVYLYGAGEGWHEVANFTSHKYCENNQFINNLCGGLFINSFYTGNIIFFIGNVLMSIALLELSRKLPFKPFTKKEIVILLINSVVFAFTWFAYAAFDTVLVGLFFSALLMLISVIYFVLIKNKWKNYPFIVYGAVAYALATFATCVVRFL